MWLQALPGISNRRLQILFISAFFTFGSASFAVPGPYSSGLANNNPGAVDPAIAGFVNNATNPVFVGWATGIESYIAAPGVDSESGFADPTKALGPLTVTEDGPTHIVSLGDLDASQITAGAQPGKITLSFNGGIRDKAGADFVVFENGLGSQNLVFGELAYVEVSTDGQHFARFASDSLTLSQVGPYGWVDPTNVHNLAGKHVNAYGNSFGTPFDLAELSNHPLVQSGDLRLNQIKYVRLIDIPGDGSSKDSSGDPIYDAWLTFGSGGFDLDAIGVLHGYYPGDANFDGIVDAVDLGILGLNWLQTGRDFSQGDFNGNGVVDVLDAYILAMNWQKTDTAPPPPFLVAIPEPSVIVLLPLVGLLVRHRRK